MSDSGKQAKDSPSKVPEVEVPAAVETALLQKNVTRSIWSKLSGIVSNLHGLIKGVFGVIFILLSSLFRFLATSVCFNYTLTFLGYLAFWSSVPLLIWRPDVYSFLLTPGFVTQVSLPWEIEITAGWSLLFLTFSLFWARRLGWIFRSEKSEAPQPPPSNTGAPGTTIPLPAPSSEVKDLKTVPVNFACPKPTSHSPSAQKRRDQFEQWAKCISAKVAFRTSIPSVQLLDKLPDGLLVRLVLKGASPDSAFKDFDLSPEGLLTCNSLERLLGAQAVTLEIQADILPGPGDKFEEGDKPGLTVVIRFTVSAYLEDAERRYLDWFKGVQRLDRLPNVKEAEPVDISLAKHLNADSAVVRFESVDVAKSGLVWNAESGSLQGSALSGNHEIAVRFACAKGNGLPRSLVLRLTCTMNPEQMWHRLQQADGDKPAVIDDAELAEQLQAAASAIGNGELEQPIVPRPSPDFGKPHRVRCAFETSGLQVRYASVRGRSHIQTSKFREDHVGAVAFHEGKALALVVSDGAGSAMLSRRGSEIVVNVGLKGLQAIGEAVLADTSLLRQEGEADIRQRFAELVGQMRERIEFESEQIRIHRPSFADKSMYATFLGCLVLPVDGRHVILSYAVGDGAIGVGLATEGSGLKSSPDHGESAGQTLFILSRGADDAARRLRIDSLSGPFALVLMSDGVSDPHVAPEDMASPDRWNQIATELARLDAGPATDGEVEAVRPFPPLVEWLEAYQKSHHDDRTVACVFHQIP